MNLLETKIGSSQRRAVLYEIKRSSGLAVRELAARIGLSYMGTKQHCVVLEKKGFLKSRNQQVGVGRPLRIYRLTDRGHEVFRSPEGTLCVSLLNHAKDLFGPTAPGKLLYRFFQERAEVLAKQMPESTDLATRMDALMKLRQDEGCMPRLDDGVLIEYHSPIASVLREYPEAAGLEEAMLSKLAGVRLRRANVFEHGLAFTRFEPEATSISCGGETS